MVVSLLPKPQAPGAAAGHGEHHYARPVVVPVPPRPQAQAASSTW
jgi:hypothetical protein